MFGSGRACRNRSSVHPNRALDAPGVASLGACYKQLNSSVGQFGTFTLQASTAADRVEHPG